MKAVLLAGGRGVRFGDLTLNTPKPLISIAGKALIRHVLDVLPPQIDGCIVIIGHLGGKIVQEIGEEYRNLPIQYIEQKMTGTGGALLSAQKSLQNEKQFLVVGSDDIFGPKELPKLICDSASYGITYGVPNSKSSMGVIFDENEMFVGFRAGYKQGEARHFGVGAYILPGTFFSVALHKLPNGEYSIPHSLPGMPFPVRVRHIHRWLPVNNQKELEYAEQHIGVQGDF